MNLIELSKYLQDEQAAENYLYEKGILKKYTECPHCGFDKLGHLSRNRIKCYKCKKEWHKRKGSFLEGKHLTNGIFISILKLYCDGFGIISVANQLGINEKTVNEVYEDLTHCLFDHFNLKREILNEPEFLLTQQGNDQIIPCVLSNIKNKNNSTTAKLSIVKNRNIDLSYSFSCILTWISSKERKQKNNINRFYSYLLHNFAKYRGISHDHFQQYFGLLIIRYNLKEKDMFPMLIKLVKTEGWSKLPDARKSTKD